MKVELWLVGKTKESWVSEAMELYVKRCARYCTFSVITIAESRLTDPTKMRKEETERIVSKLQKSQKAFTVLLDENGKHLSSVEFSSLLSKQQSLGNSAFRFIIGGAFGVEHSFHSEMDYVLSLSPMTFPHQLVRVIFLEQLYRAFTILRGEGYHH